MPLSPLHFGVLAPVNHFFPGKVSNVSFVLVTLWIDAQSIVNVFTHSNEPAHGLSHSFLVVAFTATLVAAVGVRSWKWVLGAYFGAFTHVILDMLVHADMQPFYPLDGNPAYMGWMHPLSLLLLPFTIWFIQQNVSAAYRYVQTNMAARQT